jgi:chromosome segregation ATPase
LELERKPSVLLAARTERDRHIAQLTEELALKSTLLEQAEANAVEAARRAGSELREYVDGQRLKWTSLVKQRDVELVDMQAKLDELLLSRDQQIGQHERELASVRAKLEANESELEAVRLRLAEAEKGSTSLDELVVSHDQQVGRYEKELTDMCAKLEANESELEAVRLRLTDAEKGLTKSKAEAERLRAQNATGSVNRDEDQVTRRLLERMQAIEAEVASKRWNEKSIEEMECRNEG